jgi:hypothetical protein
MAKPLKVKVAQALRKAVGDGARIEFENAPGQPLVGLVLSDFFAGKSAGERQDHVWKYLDASLTALERRRIAFIVTDTPREHEVLKAAAG